MAATSSAAAWLASTEGRRVYLAAPTTSRNPAMADGRTLFCGPHSAPPVPRTSFMRTDGDLLNQYLPHCIHGQLLQQPPGALPSLLLRARPIANTQRNTALYNPPQTAPVDGQKYS
ncbi:hypothetical protein GGX14DRAFT_557872 [Mycena pura]|uniref:Uncharacterized protein n=1 Tax=Mycena pura TaxID=153505 RepID=A0AAD7E134_9AGAR|nr:hypothetical protein GGX14DRAFT_557872 [Mycena pura]